MPFPLSGEEFRATGAVKGAYGAAMRTLDREDRPAMIPLEKEWHEVHKSLRKIG